MVNKRLGSGALNKRLVSAPVHAGMFSPILGVPILIELALLVVFTVMRQTQGCVTTSLCRTIKSYGHVIGHVISHYIVLFEVVNQGHAFE